MVEVRIKNDIYKKKNKNAYLLLLDAITLKTKRKFDCIYSNKVLIHLTKQELTNSLKKKSVRFRNIKKKKGQNSFLNE